MKQNLLKIFLPLLLASATLTACGSTQPDPTALRDDLSAGPSGSFWYKTNSIVLIAGDGTELSEVESLAAAVGGEIADRIESVDYYRLALTGEQTYESLETLCQQLEENPAVLTAHVDVFDYFPVSGDTIEEQTAMWQFTEDGILHAEDIGDISFSYVHADALDTYYDGMSPVAVGLLDYPVDHTHDDLAVANADTYSADGITATAAAELGHGTQTAGIIAAIRDNGIGIDGLCPTTELYSHNAADQTVSERTAELVQMIAEEQVRVLNFSIAYPTEISAAAHLGNENARRYIENETEYYTALLTKLLDDGHDFLICQGAGNENGTVMVEKTKSYFGYAVAKTPNAIGGIEVTDMDARWSFFPSAITEERLKERILVVGACDTFGMMTSFSNIGSRVDMVAPGMMVLSTFPGNAAIPASGTSIAAPFVSGTAACMYAMNPGLTAPEVKAAILGAASEAVDGYPLLDVASALESIN